MFKFLKDRKKKDNKGFTLVELVIVIAILAILVGLLAPQYTKYVEKSRKAADASNMDEMVKVVKVYAADPASELPTGKYTIIISDKKADGTKITAEALNGSTPNKTGLVTKSQKWDAGKPAPIQAVVTVNEDGGTSVTYPSTKTFETYMTSAGSATGTGTAPKPGDKDKTDGK